MSPVRFPNLGYEFLLEKTFSIGTLEIAFYGVIIAVGMILGALLAYAEANRTGQNVDHYIDYTIFGIIGAILGARLYYVAFEWKAVTAGATNFGQTLLAIINLRSGGLAIYGGIIGAALVMVIYCRVKKLNVFQFLDTVVLGLILGQIIGRWGNFFNREAFGSFTFTFLGNSMDVSEVGFFKMFEMLIPTWDGGLPSSDIYDNTMVVSVYGKEYVKAMPTFLFESVGNLIILILLLIFRDKKKFYGETASRYLIGYGALRFFLEGFRTDQLKIGTVAVSQIVSLIIMIAGIAIIVIMRVKLKGQPSKVAPVPTKEERKAAAEARKAEEKKREEEKKLAKKRAKTSDVLDEEDEEVEAYEEFEDEEGLDTDEGTFEKASEEEDDEEPQVDASDISEDEEL